MLSGLGGRPGPESDLAMRKGPFSGHQVASGAPQRQIHRKKCSTHAWGRGRTMGLRGKEAGAGVWALALSPLPLGRRTLHWKGWSGVLRPELLRSSCLWSSSSSRPLEISICRFLGSW